MLLALLALAAGIAPGTGFDRAARAAEAGPPALPSLTLRFRFLAGGQPVVLEAASPPDRHGQIIEPTRIAMLLSDFRLCRADGGCVSPPQTWGLLDPGADHTTVTLAAIPAGDYTSIGFVIGLPAAVNHGDPSAHPAGHPLNPLVNSLHWSWRAGYGFAAREGRYRRGGGAGEGRGEKEAQAQGQAQAQAQGQAQGQGQGQGQGQQGGSGGFVYHLANDGNTVPVRTAVALRHDGRRDLGLDVDLGAVLEQVAPDGFGRAGSASTHSRPDDPVAARLVAALAAAFRAAEPEERLRGQGGTGGQDNSEGQDGGSGSTVVASGPADAGDRAVVGAASRDFDLTLPPGFPRPDLPEDNRPTRAGVALGERLFHDARLSRDGSVSCASCHVAALGLVDAGRRASVGVAGRVGQRRAMPLTNLAWSGHFGWDGRHRLARDQALQAIAEPDEMDLALDEAVARLAGEPSYREAFAEAFGAPTGAEPDAAPNVKRIGLALEQFLLTRLAASSRVDLALQRKLVLTDQEREGFRLFLSEHDPARGVRGGDCFHCHGGPLFSSTGFHNNGLDAQFADPGRARITGRAADTGKFKAPSLRNVALRPPYMHDGRFATLAEVVEHYSSGTVPSATLDPNIAKHPNQAGLQLNEDEKAALVAFLEALTDVGKGPGLVASGK